MGRALLLPITIMLIFTAFHFSMYMLLTRRLSNNFSGTSQAKMVDVGAYLPHEEGSKLARVDSSLKLEDDLPVLDGAAALLPVYAAIVDAVYPVGSVTYEGGEFSDDNYYGENFAPDSKLQYRNTVRGYRAVVDGDADIFFCAAPSEEQRQYAKDRGVELIYVPIGLEAFVFFVNENNPVETLSSEQIRGIYAGEYTNWEQVGGSDRVINPVTRLEGSGSQSAMEAFMGAREIAMKSPFAIIGGSIGFSFRYYMEGIVNNEAVKLLSVDGVSPTIEHIADRSYPIVAEFYAAYRADNDNENILRLIDWILSEEGQALIEASGYVKIGNW
ncbi:MAG: substrate-binding domain-containing protein [Clostridia bacterium]|nr:substrate-binding domain-containing protein [Clostridia bacterium]